MSTKKTTVTKKTKPIVKKTNTKKVAKKTTKKMVKKAMSKKPVKKIVKKSVAKKTAKKKSVKTVKKDLVYADENTSFWVTDGQILNSLLSLRDALAEMEKEVYVYHSGKAQNDFANWVEHVLEDNACASDLVKAKTPKSAKITVVKHLKHYSL